MDWKSSSAAIDSIFKFCTECITDHLFIFNDGSEVIVNKVFKIEPAAVKNSKNKKKPSSGATDKGK